MTYLVGSASTARFSATDTYNSEASFNKALFNGNDTEGVVASASANAATLNLYISSWGSVANIKACLYSNTNVLVETVIINSSVGVGVVPVSLANTLAIVSGDKYRLAIYTDSNNAITLHTDTAGLTRRNSSASGNYTTPIDPLPAGSYVSANEFYWSIEDAAAVVNPILTDILIDDENAGAILASETGLRVHVYDADGGTLLLSVTNATTDANGRFTIDDDLVGSVASTPFVVIKVAAGRTICGTMTVTDGNA